MNHYQHACILMIGWACVAGCWSAYEDEDGKPANDFLFCIAVSFVIGCVFVGILNIFLWLGTL